MSNNIRNIYQLRTYLQVQRTVCLLMLVEFVKALKTIKKEGTQVEGRLSLTDGNRAAVFTPEFELEANTIYRIKLTAEIRDEFGLCNVTILDPGILQGPEGGTIYGPGGITTFIPEGAFDEFIAIKVTMLSPDTLQDVEIDPALRNVGVFEVDTGGVRPMRN